MQFESNENTNTHAHTQTNKQTQRTTIRQPVLGPICFTLRLGETVGIKTQTCAHSEHSTVTPDVEPAEKTRPPRKTRAGNTCRQASEHALLNFLGPAPSSISANVTKLSWPSPFEHISQCNNHPIASRRRDGIFSWISQWPEMLE